MIYTEFGSFQSVEMLFSHMVRYRINFINDGHLFYRGEFKKFSMSLDELFKICYEK